MTLPTDFAVYWSNTAPWGHWLKGQNANLLVKPTEPSVTQQSRLRTATAKMSQSLSSMQKESCGVLHRGSPQPASNSISYSFCYQILFQPFWNAAVPKQVTQFHFLPLYTLSLSLNFLSVAHLNAMHQAFCQVWTELKLFKIYLHEFKFRFCSFRKWVRIKEVI